MHRTDLYGYSSVPMSTGLLSIRLTDLGRKIRRPYLNSLRGSIWDVDNVVQGIRLVLYIRNLRALLQTYRIDDYLRNDKGRNTWEYTAI